MFRKHRGRLYRMGLLCLALALLAPGLPRGAQASEVTPTAAVSAFPVIKPVFANPLRQADAEDIAAFLVPTVTVSGGLATEPGLGLPTAPALTEGEAATPAPSDAPTPTPSPTPAPYAYQAGEIATLQKILNYSGYLGTDQSADTVATGTLDDATREAVRQYLSTLNADPAWERDYFTRKEYRQLYAFFSTVPPAIPTPSPMSGPMSPAPTPVITPTPSAVPTPLPRAITLTAPTLPPDSRVLVIPQVLSDGLAVQGMAEPGQAIRISLTVAANSVAQHTAMAEPSGEFATLFSAEECAALDGAQDTALSVTYAHLPESLAANVPMQYQTARDGNARIVSLSFSHRKEELHIQGQVYPEGITVALLNEQGDPIAETNALSDGQFSLTVENGMAGGRVPTDAYRLILNGDILRPETLHIANVKQEVLIPFSYALQTREVGLIAAGLLALGFALMFACRVSRKHATGNRPDHRPGQGGDPRG